jgi:serine/threonine protein kinase
LERIEVSTFENDSEDIRSLPKGYQLSDYRIEGPLGHGAFGITYLATDTMLNRKVAIKEYFPREFAARDGTLLVKPAGNKEDRDNFSWGLKRFLEEARVLALFDHPNIVPVRRFFEANGTAYLVMDYCDGVPLDSMISKNGSLTKDQVEKIIYPILDGLERVHKANFLHRDIKP